MREDYLWDKTGEDAEIERLENALAAFRCADAAPPALPSKILPFEAKTAHRFFRPSFALAACAVLAFLSFGIWLKVSSDKTEIAKNTTETIAPQTNATISAGSEIKKPDVLIAKTTATRKPTDERNVVKARKILTNVRPNKSTAQIVAVAKPKVRLTKEEKYAYDQLMLALSITSSELKLVKDKAAGVAEESNALEN